MIKNWTVQAVGVKEITFCKSSSVACNCSISGSFWRLLILVGAQYLGKYKQQQLLAMNRETETHLKNELENKNRFTKFKLVKQLFS